MKKVIRNAVSALLLAIALLVTQIPTTEVAADTAAASDFQLNESTLVRYVGTAGDVSIPATVNKIGEEAFAGNTTIKEIAFKGEVVNIAYRAFAGCSELKEITLPDSVLELGNGAFAGCESLETVHIGKELEKIGIGAFAGCERLKSITVDKDNPNFTVDDGCLYNKEKTVLYFMIPVREKETYSMPSTVTEIGAYAFWGCDNLKNLSLSNTLQEISAFSFSNCKSLQALSVPYSVNSIDAKAFADCVNLETVYIPPSVTSIHATAFDGCPKLKIVADMGTVAYDYYEKWIKNHEDQSEYEDTGNRGDEDEGDGNGGAENEKPGNGDNGQGNPAGVLGETHVVGNKAVVFIDNALPPVYGSQSQETANPGTDGAGNGSDGTGAEGAGNTVTDNVLDNPDEKDISIPKFTVAGGTILADQAYYMSNEMTDYVLPEGITEIGEFAFARSNLNKISLPEGVTSVGYGAFYHCEQLRNITIPSTVTEIAPRAFEKTLWLQNWIAGGEEDYLIVGDGILLAYRGSGATLTLPDRVKKIAPGAFENHTEIVNVLLPDGLREIGEGAFAGCRNLTGVQGGKYVTKIADRAFADCPIETLHIGENVKQMGLGAVDFSDTGKSTSTKVVVFEHQETLPVVTFEQTAGRLSNTDARKPVLNDVLFAIVDKAISEEDLAGTVLDAHNYGFEGVVGYISSESRSIVTVLSCNMTKEELEAYYMPEYIQIDGKNYHVEGWEYLEAYDDKPQNQTGIGEVKVLSTAEAFPPSHKMNAALTGDTGEYYLKVQDSEDARTALDTAFDAIYDQKLPGGAVCFDLTLVEAASGVSLTKLGNNPLTLQLPIPEPEGNGKVRIVTVDRNGQLENVKYRKGENDSLILEISHLSPFAIYRTDGSAGGRMDESPDTGEVIHPKWFAVLGLVSLAAAVFFYKPGKEVPGKNFSLNNAI